jgi:peptide-methionine (S)-S-oxide reductase
MRFFRQSTTLPTPLEALPGRATPLETALTHYLNGHPLKGPWKVGFEHVLFGMGCFWGAERKFWQMGEGIYVTAVGYSAGHTPNPTYQEVCSGMTGHNEVVLVVYNPTQVSFEALLKTFWESHDPTQGMRQGNDSGAQYRSGIYVTNPTQKRIAIQSRDTYGKVLANHRFGPITTEILDVPEFYYAEAIHQQYLAKNPNGYCGLGGTGISCPIGVGLKV